MFKKFRLIIKSRQMRLPAPTSWPRIFTPSFSLALPRFEGVQMANSRIKYVVTFATLISGLAVTVGLIFAIYDVNAVTFSYPDGGAQYNLSQGKMGEKLPNYEDGSDNMTLRLNIPDGARYEKLVFKDMNLGGKPINEVIKIERATSGADNTYLYVGKVTIQDVEAKRLTLQDSHINNLRYAFRADGATIDLTIDQTIPEYTVTGLRGAGTFTAEDSTVDRIVITLASGSADVGELVFENIATGGCGVASCSVDLRYIKTGHLQLGAEGNASSIRIGSGDGININDFIIYNTTRVGSAGGVSIDEPIAVR
jgi:hypothetical protein